jgi:hypothetical protein
MFQVGTVPLHLLTLAVGTFAALLQMALLMAFLRWASQASTRRRTVLDRHLPGAITALAGNGIVLILCWLSSDSPAWERFGASWVAAWPVMTVIWLGFLGGCWILGTRCRAHTV